ncbi:MAG: hypothetical protein GY751_17845, partial [Bacteroidetes bacterium]|nr:hypothetical protein [Bacteroidota bacterium]
MKSFLLSISLFFLSFSSSFSQIIYVDASASGTNTGTNWTDAFTDLQDALVSAQAGDEVWVAQGTYYPTPDTSRMIYFEVPKGVALYGGFSGTESSLEERDWLAHETVLSGDIGLPGDST